MESARNGLAALFSKNGMDLKTLVIVVAADE